MRVDEFEALVSGEEERHVTRTVHPDAARVLAERMRPGGVPLLELAKFAGRTVQRTCTYRHILGPAASDATIDRWQIEHPQCRIPADLRNLLLRINGIHLWADSQTGRAPFGIAPVEEWALFGERYGDPGMGETEVVLSYDENGSEFISFEPTTSTYVRGPTTAPSMSWQIGKSVADLLDHLWNTRRFP